MKPLAASPNRGGKRRTVLVGPPMAAAVPVVGGSVLQVRLFWKQTLLSTHAFQDGLVTIGGSEDAGVPLSTWPSKRDFTLARRTGSKWILALPNEGATADYEERGAPISRPRLEHEGRVDRKGRLELGKAGRLTLRVAEITLVIEEVARPLQAERSKFLSDRGFLRQLGGITVFATLIMATLRIIPIPHVQERTMQPPPPRAFFKVPEPPKKKEPPKKEEEKEEKKEEAKKEEETPKEKEAPKAKKVSKAPPPKIATPSWAIKALGALDKKSQTPSLLKSLGNLQASGGASSTSNYRLAGLVGKGPANPLGVGGFGGGGTGGPITAGAGQLLGGRGGGLGALGHGLKGVGGAVTQARARQVTVRGSISREEIAKVVNDHLKEVQFCYERALIRDANVAGKLLLEWTIDMSGGVSNTKIKESSIKNPEVGSCIVGKLRGWQFPKPKGGIVVVTYPFLFNSVGF